METNVELELALLQIAQLQEELEYYYLEYAKLKKSKPLNSELTTAASLVRQARLNDKQYLSSAKKSYLDQLLTENNQLTENVKKLQVHNAELEVTNIDLEAKNTDLVCSFKDPQVTLSADCSRLNIEVEESNSQVLVLSARNAELEVKNEELETKNTDLVRSFKDVEVTLSADCSRLNIEVEALNSQVSVLSARNAELEAICHEFEVLAEQQSQLELTLKHQLDENAELARTARLTQKMFAKSQIDLDHLREKYAEKTNSEAELVELITELREKLTVASKYYYQLQQEHPELLNHANNVQDLGRGS
ncbi:hypothetical protein [Shewanella halifaxensis]|uniref:hypothetical protein n=1 Tax=Shewanella halifaxensis TaxID=271098 RepID=UPI000D5A1D0A|nr:hypothetical protein [Shewanella halifaxensis]